MMRKIFCLALGHRLRVVQEFTPYCRRVKCTRCGGDWGMNDDVRAMIEWSPDVEQHHRDMVGAEILEPLPAWRSLPVEPLSPAELLRAARWPGAFAMAVGFTAGLTVEAAGFGLAVRLIVTAAIGCATMHLLMPQVYRRGYERKCNSLRA